MSKNGRIWKYRGILYTEKCLTDSLSEKNNRLLWNLNLEFYTLFRVLNCNSKKMCFDVHDIFLVKMTVNMLVYILR